MGRTTRGSAGHGGDRLPQSDNGSMAGQVPSRYRADGEGDDASGGADTTFWWDAGVTAVIVVLWVAALVAVAVWF